MVVVAVATRHYYVHDRNTSCQIKWCRAHDCFFFFLPDDESFFSINPHCISYSFFIFQCFLPVIYLWVCKSSLVNLYYHNFPWQLGAPQKHSFSGPKEVLNLQKQSKNDHTQAIYKFSPEVGTMVGAAFNQVVHQQLGIIGSQEMP